MLQSTKEQAAKLAKSCIPTKLFWLQVEYMVHICVIVCNVPVNLPGETLTAEWKRWQNFMPLGDDAFQLCLNREDFQAITNMLYFQDRQMMVVVGGRKPHCWSCKQIGHLAKVCPQKAADSTLQPKEAENTTNATPEAENTNTDNK